MSVISIAVMASPENIESVFTQFTSPPASIDKMRMGQRWRVDKATTLSPAAHQLKQKLVERGIPEGATIAVEVAVRAQKLAVNQVLGALKRSGIRFQVKPVANDVSAATDPTTIEHNGQVWEKARSGAYQPKFPAGSSCSNDSST